MSDNAIDLDQVRPCPTCAALVLTADLEQHQQWHADTAPRNAAG